MKRMLINATQSEELRVALVDGQSLYDFDIEIPSKEQKKSNVYKGIITRVEPSLEAVFVNYTDGKHGFLPFKEIAPKYSGNSRSNLKETLKEGQEIVVQIEKEERGNKGAALTTYLSLAGTYLVVMPDNPKAGGISRRIEGDTRNELRQAMADLVIPEDMGVIVRTAGCGKSTEELQWDLDYLVKLANAIETTAQEKKAPALIFQESNVIIRALRDHLRNNIDEIIVDDPESFNLVQSFLTQVMPTFLPKAKLYNESVPLFNRYQIESQIELAYSREVPLPSGGSIIIDYTEALTSVDINSARSTKGSDIEETALNTNLEAADEIAKQFRIRDLGGLFVIDFIDMMANKNQRAVENRLRDALKIDRARIQTSRISRFGLLEMSRQRIQPSLGESTQLTCPRCKGQGAIRNVESVALSVLRLIEEEAMKPATAKVMIHLPIESATFLLNEKRQIIEQIEQRLKVGIIILPSKHLETPAYEIERIKTSDPDENAQSYENIQSEAINIPDFAQKMPTSNDNTAIKNFLPESPAPEQKEPVKVGFFQRLFGKSKTSEKPLSYPTHFEDGYERGSEDNENRNHSGRRPRNANRNNRNTRNNRNNRNNHNTQNNPTNRTPINARNTPEHSSTENNQSNNSETVNDDNRGNVVEPSNESPSNRNNRNNRNNRSRRGNRNQRNTQNRENSSSSSSTVTSKVEQNSDKNNLSDQNQKNSGTQNPNTARDNTPLVEKTDNFKSKPEESTTDNTSTTSTSPNVTEEKRQPRRRNRNRRRNNRNSSVNRNNTNEVKSNTPETDLNPQAASETQATPAPKHDSATQNAPKAQTAPAPKPKSETQSAPKAQTAAPTKATSASDNNDLSRTSNTKNSD